MQGELAIHGIGQNYRDPQKNVSLYLVGCSTDSAVDPSDGSYVLRTLPMPQAEADAMMDSFQPGAVYAFNCTASFASVRSALLQPPPSPLQGFGTHTCPTSHCTPPRV